MAAHVSRGAVAKALSVSGLIVFGTTTSLFAKIVYQIQSTGADGTTKKPFTKPWAMTTLMFIGMSTCLPLALLQERRRRAAVLREAEEAPLLRAGSGDDVPQPQDPKPLSELKQTLMLAIPTFFDLLATILMNIGLLYVAASVYQMLRGAEMVFAALFAVTFLGRKLNRFHLLGILCCVAGVIMVGTSSYLGGSSSATVDVTPEQILCGMALIVISQAVQAAQLTFEDFFMADLNIAPMKIVGWEGVFGVVGTLGVMAPVTFFLPGVEGEGIHEDIVDTLAMIRNSRALQAVLLVDCLALALYNIVGMVVTGQLGAVFRTVLETTRTLFVWLVGLLLFYTPLGGGTLGEAWTQYSWLQALGFCVLVSGTLVYQRGEEETCRLEMAEALAVQAAQEPYGYYTDAYGEPTADGWVATQPSYDPQQAQQAAAAAAATTHPIAVAAPAQQQHHHLLQQDLGDVGTLPMDVAPPMSSSFKATQTIASGSYSRSLGRGSYMRRPGGGPE